MPFQLLGLCRLFIFGEVSCVGALFPDTEISQPFYNWFRDPFAGSQSRSGRYLAWSPGAGCYLGLLCHWAGWLLPAAQRCSQTARTHTCEASPLRLVELLGFYLCPPSRWFGIVPLFVLCVWGVILHCGRLRLFGGGARVSSLCCF